MMYEDIVASTEPMNYVANRKGVEDFQSYFSRYLPDEPVYDFEDATQHIEMPEYATTSGIASSAIEHQMISNHVAKDSCGRNPESEED